MPLQEATFTWNPTCIDVLDEIDTYKHLLEASVGNTIDQNDCGGSCPYNASMCSKGKCIRPTCSAIASFCNENTNTGVRARQLCSVTCGCADPRSNLALWAPTEGCPKTCLGSGQFKGTLNDIACKDVHVGDSDLVNYLDIWENVSHSWPSVVASTSVRYINGLRRYGCEYLKLNWTDDNWIDAHNRTRGTISPYRYGYNLCTSSGFSYPTKPLSYFCPIACGCNTDGNGCPQSCMMRNTSDMPCPVHQRRCESLEWHAPGCSLFNGTHHISTNASLAHFCPMLL